MTRHLDKLHLTDWGTPDGFYTAIQHEHQLTLDVCALGWNAKCHQYISPEDDGLLQPWGLLNWCNMPFNNVLPWFEKAYRLACYNDTKTVCLAPMTPDTSWFVQLGMLGQVKAITPRLQFKPPPEYHGKSSGPTFAQALYVYSPAIVRGDEPAGMIGHIDHRNKPVQPGRDFLRRLRQERSWSPTE